MTSQTNLHRVFFQSNPEVTSKRSQVVQENVWERELFAARVSAFDRRIPPYARKKTLVLRVKTSTSRPVYGGQFTLSPLSTQLILPACRRLLCPLLHACNKGNKRRLHAGKVDETIFFVFYSPIEAAPEFLRKPTLFQSLSDPNLL